MEYEAFVYLWYDAPNKKYYLGKHKGTPEDGYTHSSTMWEHFTKDNIPEGVTRRILAYGTNEEMCVLEHNLLVNRKKRCWDRYYNNGLGDPRYVDMSGENNPRWKGGITYDMKEYDKKRNHTPKRKAYLKKLRQTPKYREQRKQYEKNRVRPPEYEEWRREFEKKPERKAYLKKYKAEWRAKKKLERQGTGTLEPFMG